MRECASLLVVVGEGVPERGGVATEKSLSAQKGGSITRLADSILCVWHGRMCLFRPLKGNSMLPNPNTL